MYQWFDHILLHSRTRSEQPAMIMEDRVVTYGMLGVVIENTARRLAALDIAPGALVAVLVANPIRHLALCLALFRIGVRSISLEHSQQGLGALKFAAVLGDAEAKALLGPSSHVVEVTDGWFSLEPVSGAALPESFSDEAQICRSGLTSGTTGTPKLFDYSVGHIGRHIPAAIVDDCRRVLDMPGLSAAWGFRAACAALATGKAVCFATSAFQAIRMIELFAIDCALTGTEQLVALTRLAKKTGATLSSLRTVVVGGGVPTRALLDAAAMNFCRDIRCRYGSSEFGIIAEARPADVMAHPGLVGRIVPGIEVGVFDAQGVRCAAGQAGFIKGRLKGNSEEARADPARPWIDFGDVGWVTADGRLFVVGRSADIADPAHAAARQISPAHEVEHLLRLEWDASDAAAIAIEDASPNTKPEIWIATVDCKDARAEKLQAILRQRGIEATVRLFPMQSIPRGTNGKVQRAQLKSLMLAATSR